MDNYHDNLTTLAKRLKPLITTMVTSTVTTAGAATSEYYVYPWVIIDDSGTTDAASSGSFYGAWLPLDHLSTANPQVYGGITVPGWSGTLTATPLIQCSTSSQAGSIYATLDALEVGGAGASSTDTAFPTAVSLPARTTAQIKEVTELSLTLTGTGKPWGIILYSEYFSGSGFTQAHTWYGWRITFS